MAEKILNTRVALKIDTLENWLKSTLPLKRGELAIATDAGTAGIGLADSDILIKVGIDGVKTFSDLEWNIAAKASDVLAVCKDTAQLTAFVNNIIANAGIASDEVVQGLANRLTDAEGAITLLNGADTQEGSVAKAIKDAIDALDLANTYVAKEEGKSLVADTEITKLAGVSQGANKVENVGGGKIKIDGTEVTVYTHPDKHTIAEVDGLQDALDDAAAALNTYKGEMVTTLAGKQDVIPENTYDAYGSAAAALTSAQSYADQAESDAVTAAKAYVDEEDKFYNGITTVNALGGIPANTSLDNKTTHEILDMLLFPYVAFSITSSSRSAAATTLENGATQTLSSCSITVAKKSKPITSITLYNGSNVLESKTGDAVANGGTITFNGFNAITVSKSNNPNLKFTVTDGQTSTDRNVGASTFVYPYYWGVCAPDATVDEALVEGLTKSISSKGNKTDVSFTCANQRQVFAYPKAHGVLKSIIDPNNFEIIDSFTRSELSITGLDGTTQTYYVYVSGACSVTDFKIDFKY